MEEKDKVILVVAGAGVTIVAGKILNDVVKGVRVELEKRKKIRDRKTQVSAAVKHIQEHLHRRIDDPNFTKDGFLAEYKQETAFIEIIKNQPLD